MIAAEYKKLLLSKQHISFPILCSKFYLQILECWFDFYSKEPETYSQVLQENLQYNTFLKIGNTQLDLFFEGPQYSQNRGYH